MRCRCTYRLVAACQKGEQMMKRITFYTLVLLLAGLVVIVQLDRQSLDDWQIGLAVPEPFRAVSQQRLIEVGLASGESATGTVKKARQLIRRRPLPARHLVLYAQAAQREGDPDATISALEIAAMRGWREPIPQIAAAQAGLISGNFESAAQRLAAMNAIGGLGDETNGILIAMLAQEQGREAIAAQLAVGGRWTRYFVRQLATTATLEQFADTIGRAWDKGAKLDCDQLLAAAEGNLGNGQDELVARFWPGNCPT